MVMRGFSCDADTRKDCSLICILSCILLYRYSWIDRGGSVQVSTYRQALISSLETNEGLTAQEPSIIVWNPVVGGRDYPPS